MIGRRRQRAPSWLAMFDAYYRATITAEALTRVIRLPEDEFEQLVERMRELRARAATQPRAKEEAGHAE